MHVTLSLVRTVLWSRCAMPHLSFALLTMRWFHFGPVRVMACLWMHFIPYRHTHQCAFRCRSAAFDKYWVSYNEGLVSGIAAGERMTECVD